MQFSVSIAEEAASTEENYQEILKEFDLSPYEFNDERSCEKDEEPKRMDVIFPLEQQILVADDQAINLEQLKMVL